MGIRNGYMLVLTPLSASRQILGSISEVLLLTDPEYRVITANYAATIFFGCSEADLIGTQMPLLEDAEGTPSQGELCSDDGSRWIRLRETPIDTRGGVLMGRLLIGRGMTDEKLRTDLLQRSLAEKESLLREIRHRAYNTLQMIASILHLKSDQLADPDGRRVIAECNARIRAIAGVDVVYHLDNVSIDLQPAVTVSLIIAELVSNVARHAFPTGQADTMWVRLSSGSSECWTLSMTDNGSGFEVDRKEPMLSFPCEFRG